MQSSAQNSTCKTLTCLESWNKGESKLDYNRRASAERNERRLANNLDPKTMKIQGNIWKLNTHRGSY